VPDSAAAASHGGAASSVAPSIDELWLRCQQGLCSYVAHDLKGALNGVSVNLEVVRGRAERPATPITEVLRFAGAAADQLGVVIRMNNALLSIGRAARGPAEVSTIARQIVALVEDTLRSDGATLGLIVEGGMAGSTSASTTAVRLALGESLMAAALQKREVSVRIRVGASPTVEITAGTGFDVAPEVRRALDDAGISMTTDGHGISIVFPAPTEPSIEDA
jgi:hypothetical protein